MNKFLHAAAGFALMLFILMLVACSSKSGAEKKVKAELDALKSSDYIGSELNDLRNSLSDEGKADFDQFIKNVKGFDYEITGSKEEEEPDADHTVVTVKVKTYDFGTEYLATWTDYLKEHGGTLSTDDDLTDFYESLFARLSKMDEKEYIKSVDIICIDPIDNGEWIANIKDNKGLLDSIFGGMLSEMKTLADE